MIRPLSFFLLVVMNLLFACATPELVRVTEDNVRVDTTRMAEDPGMKALIAPYRAKLAEEMNLVVGHLAEALEKGYPESGLGNMVADVLQVEAQRLLGQPVDFALANSGGLRRPDLPAGPITRKMIFELLPFDNRLVVLSLSGKTVVQLIEHMADRGGWPVSETLRYVIQDGRAVDIRIDGEPIHEDRTYRVAMPDYVANGGDDCAFLVDFPQEDAGVFMRDAVIHYFAQARQQNRALSFPLDGRVRELE